MKASRGIFTRPSPSHAKKSSNIRNLLCTSGFAEGWATYIEPMPTSTPPIIFRILLPTELAKDLPG